MIYINKIQFYQLDNFLNYKFLKIKEKKIRYVYCVIFLGCVVLENKFNQLIMLLNRIKDKECYGLSIYLMIFII